MASDAQAPAVAAAQQQVDVIELLDSDTDSDGSWRIAVPGTARKRQVVDSSDTEGEASPPLSKEPKSREGPVSKQAAAAGPQAEQQQRQGAAVLPPYFAAIPGLQTAALPAAPPAKRTTTAGPPKQWERPAGAAPVAAAAPTQRPQQHPQQQLQQRGAAPAVPAAPAAPAGRAPWRALSLSAAAFRKQREALAVQMFAELNAVVFEGRLPTELPIMWNNRLATTAGLTHYKREAPAAPGQPATYTARVELGAKVLDEMAKLERTLAHELCHAAAWLVNHTAKPPHGPVFRAWADRAAYFYPHLDITTCHSYEIFYPFRWRCTAPGCGQEYGRHSNSIDVGRKVCGACRGRLEFLGRFSRDGSPAKRRPAAGFAAFVKEHYAAARGGLPPGTPQAEVMKALGRDWVALQAAGGAGAAGGAAEAGRDGTAVVNLLGELNLGERSGL
eukprot:scaffold21.g2120.t1